MNIDDRFNLEKTAFYYSAQVLVEGIFSDNFTGCTKLYTSTRAAQILVDIQNSNIEDNFLYADTASLYSFIKANIARQVEKRLGIRRSILEHAIEKMTITKLAVALNRADLQKRIETNRVSYFTVI